MYIQRANNDGVVKILLLVYYSLNIFIVDREKNIMRFRKQFIGTVDYNMFGGIGWGDTRYSTIKELLATVWPLNALESVLRAGKVVWSIRKTPL